MIIYSASNFSNYFVRIFWAFFLLLLFLPLSLPSSFSSFSSPASFTSSSYSRFPLFFSFSFCLFHPIVFNLDLLWHYVALFQWFSMSTSVVFRCFCTFSFIVSFLLFLLLLFTTFIRTVSLFNVRKCLIFHLVSLFPSINSCSSLINFEINAAVFIIP